MKLYKLMRVLVVGILMILSGCSSPIELEEAIDEITMMLPKTHYKSFFKEMIKEFEKQSKVYEVNVQVIPDNQWIEFIKTRVAVEQLPDILRIDKRFMIQIGEENFVEFKQEDTEWYDRIIDSQLEEKLIDGKLYGLPASSERAIGIVYNKDLFKKYEMEAPRSYEEFLDVCKKFKEEGIIPFYAADKDLWTTQIWFSASAPQVVEEECWNKIMSNQTQWGDYPVFIEILDKMKAIRKLGYTNENYLTATYEEGNRLMARKKVAMTAAVQSTINDIQAINPRIELGLKPMLFSDKLTVEKGGGMFSVDKESDSMEGSKKFLEWLAMSEQIDLFTQGWGDFYIFEDQKYSLEPWQQEIWTNYIQPQKIVEEMNGQLVPIEMNEFWKYQKEMLIKDIESEEILLMWEEHFERQAKDKKLKGF